MSERSPCVILGCRRTFKRDTNDDGTAEYMCGDHYRMTSNALRRLRTKLKRMARRLGWTERLTRLDNWAWERAKKQATERAMGL